VSAGVDARPVGLMLSISEIAQAAGVSKQAVSKRVARLEASGALKTQRGPRGRLLVNRAEYDRAVGDTGDLAHAQAPAQDEAPAATDPAAETASASYSREQAREKSYKAELARLDLDERLGKLVAADEVAHAAGRVAETLVRAVDQFPTRAAELLLAGEQNGVEGIRTVLRSIGRDLRELASRELVTLADVGKGSAGAGPGADQADEGLD
jgi:DNA-binding Lrp family transcriptional regulator